MPILHENLITRKPKRSDQAGGIQETDSDDDEEDDDGNETKDELMSAKKRLNLYMSSTIHSKRVSKILSSRPMDFLDLKQRLEMGKMELE